MGNETVVEQGTSASVTNGAGQATAQAKEVVIWEGGPSHLYNAGYYAMCVLFCWLIIPAFMGAWRYLVTASVKYKVTSEKIYVRFGVLNKTTNQCELYRVRDYRLDAPLTLRIFHLSNLVMITADDSTPQVVLEGIKNGEWLVDQIRQATEEVRTRKNVREIDFG